MPARRSLAILLAALAPGLVACGSTSTSAQESTQGSAQALSVVDAAGRTVTFPTRPTRIVFGEQRQAYVSMILNKDKPTDKVVAWGKDMQRAAPDMWKRLAQADPDAEKIPTIGAVNSGDLSVEGLLQYKPDVFVMTLDSKIAAEKNGLLDKIEKAGIRYVVTDLRLHPGTNTPVTMRLMGALLGREKQAQDFLAYYSSIVDPLVAKAAAATPTKTFVWRAPGVTACCSTWSTVNFGEMITRVGAKNVAANLLPGEEGALTPEQLLAEQPDVVIATGGAWSAMPMNEKSKTSYVAVGYDTTPAQAAASLAKLRTQPGFEHLKAFDTKRVHAVYHQFYDAPYNFVAYQAFARWAHPDLFADVDPAATWKEFSNRFMPFPAEGTVVADLG